MKSEKKNHGVAFAVRNTLLQKVEPPTAGSARLLSMCLNTDTGPVTLITAYAPTLIASAESKDKFYCELDNLLWRRSECVDGSVDWGVEGS